MKKVLITVFLVVAFAVMNLASANAAITGLTDLHTYNGHTYGLTNQASSWTDANTFAQNNGYQLVTINDSAENTFLYDTFVATSLGGTQDHWIGLYSPTGNLANWAWVSGDTASYRNWRGGQPDTGYNQDYYAAIGYVGTAEWDNYPDTGFRTPTAIVEIVSSVPEPATMLLLGFGLAGLVGMKRFRK